MSFQSRVENLTTNSGASGDYLRNNGVGSLVSWETAPSNQCAFSAYLTAVANNVTGAGTQYFLSSMTEEFDVGSDFNPTTGQFTVPTTGRYFLAAGVSVLNLTAAMTTVDARIFTTLGATVLFINIGNPFARQGALSNQDFACSSVITQLTAGTILRVGITVFGGAGDTAEVNGGLGLSYFCGYFLGA